AMLGAVLFSGGSFFRCLVTQSWSEMPIVAPTAAMARGAIAATLFWWFGLVLHKGKWRSQALMTLTWL
ncbi:luxQ, partial [Symbiodinium necroappetens]